jgi:hypothetical protein
MLTLYDVEVENTEGIDGFTSTEIFTTGGSDEVWGMKGKMSSATLLASQHMM